MPAALTRRRDLDIAVAGTIPQSHRHAGTPNVVRDPLVDPGNPSHRYQARSTAHLDRPRSRMVALTASPPGPRSPRSPQTENATVMLGTPTAMPLHASGKPAGAGLPFGAWWVSGRAGLTNPGRPAGNSGGSGARDFSRYFRPRRAAFAGSLRQGGRS